MTYTRTTPQRIRTKLRRMQHDDIREAAQSTYDAIVRNLRATLNAQHPNASADDIEVMLSRRLEAGAKPTTAVVAPAAGIPRDVLAARKAARKRMVASGRHLRR